MVTRKRRNKTITSGPTLTEERRAENGYDKLFLRPPQPCREELAELAALLGVSPSHAAATAISECLERTKKARAA